MELDWETRPLSIAHKSQWHSSQNGAGPSTATSTSSLSTRRRSSILNAPPPGPPPSQPIPSVPAIPILQYSYDRLSEGAAMGYQNGTNSQTYPYTRPAASPGLAAVAAFSEARFAAASGPSSPPSSSSVEDLLDSPPRSMLRAAPVRAPDIVPERVLLSPTDVRSSSESRPSSRRALTKALELAREAVKLDTDEDHYAAVLAYGRSVSLLSEVMERVMRGEAAPDSHRRQNGRRRSIVAQEEEVRRLRAIHDTYAERMNTLCDAYHIPVPQHSPRSAYISSVSASTESTQPPSPSSNTPSPDSDSFVQPLLTRRRQDEYRSSSETSRYDDDTDEEVGEAEAIGTAFTSSISLHLNSSSHYTPSSAPSHPYASSAASVVTAPLPSNRVSVTPAARPLRPRASSTLPPPAPPPTSLPPPAPNPVTVPPLPEAPSSQMLKAPDVGRPRGNSVNHRRAGSGSRLAALHEEVEKSDNFSTTMQSTAITFVQGSGPLKPRGVALLAGEVESKRDSHPLPPLPSPSTPDSAITPRNPGVSASEPSSPRTGSQFTTPRPRGGSTFSVRSEMPTPTNKQSLINTSPVLGTISQRRVKTSAPPSTASSSPTESSASVPTMSRLNASALPANTATSLGITGRSRASSQPGRRPSVASNNSYPSPQAYAGAPNTAPIPRKVSVPSRLNPHFPPNITVDTALMSPPLNSMLTPLVPPPPIPYHNIPSAPLSPLPPVAPPDPLRKPYHMMTLLRQTMTSKTGGYITRRLHVPQEVWSQGGAKLTNIAEKIRVVEVLCSALEEITSWSAEYFGAGNVSSGMVMGINSIGRQEGEAWSAKLEEFSGVCDSVVGNFGKKLGVGEGFAMKKTSGVGSWGNRLTRQFDKITNGKNLDSPAAYVHCLSKLFVHVQILDEHTKALSSQPVAPLYAGFPVDVRQALEFKLRHASEFFAKVVLTFVIRDLALLLDKYVKRCEKWLAE
ncbi:hypothetical protein B0H21DRAFT_384921 [Amylocystis lapponica]|nr:hypothetical protein B0H21DRAFT_384921 [Amylocystis lapponica]